VSLKTFLATVRLYWTTFAVVTVTVLALGLAWLLLTPPQYVSTTQLLVSINGSTTAAAYQNDSVVSGRVNSYIALLTSDVVSQRVIDKLGLHMSAPELAAKISAIDVPANTSIIDVAVTDKSPGQAQQLADTVAKEFVSYTDALETPTGEDGQKVHTTVVAAASEPHSRLAERVFLGVLVALAAVLSGAVAVWIRSATDRVVRTAKGAAAAAGAPVLGSVTSATATSLADLEGYRRLRARLQSLTGSDDARVIEMASVDGNLGAVVIARNLGRAMELAGSRTIVVDADLADSPESRSSSANENKAERLDIRGGQEPAGDVAGLPDTLSAGEWAVEPDRVATKDASGLVERLRGEYEYVIIATPPVLSTLTASAVSEYADAVLLLISLGRSKRRDATRAAESLMATGAPLSGVLLVAEEGDGSEERTGAHLLESERSAESAAVP
jgi:capsular polysaccharide biosynthesis protein